MRFRASDIAAIVEGTHVGPDVEVDGASHDSRDLPAGALFVPVVAERDGHDFIAAAFERGAAATLADRTVDAGEQRGVIVVPDTAAALVTLGAAARDRLPDRVIGITGSVGKTTTKDLTAAALAARFRTHASLRSFNNELGVPLTLVNAPDDAEAVVVELGARGVGHIAWLCAFVRPTIAVVTAVEHVHTELFGSLEEVARGKGELVEALPADGTAVLNAANPHVAAMAGRTGATVLTYGTPSAEFQAEDVVVDDELHPRFTLRTPWGAVPDVRLTVRGVHNVGNALAALAAAWAAGVDLETAVSGLQSAALSPWRMELRRTPSGTRVINDAYNAGPASVRAALAALASLPVTGRRVAVLGVMAELGDDAPGLHRAVAAEAAAHGVEVIAVGAADYGPGPHVVHVDDIDAALDRLTDLGPHDAVLVKGSRVAGLERLVAQLAP